MRRRCFHWKNGRGRAAHRGQLVSRPESRILSAIFLTPQCGLVAGATTAEWGTLPYPCAPSPCPPAFPFRLRGTGAGCQAGRRHTEPQARPRVPGHSHRGQFQLLTAPDSLTDTLQWKLSAGPGTAEQSCSRKAMFEAGNMNVCLNSPAVIGKADQLQPRPCLYRGNCHLGARLVRAAGHQLHPARPRGERVTPRRTRDLGHWKWKQKCTFFSFTEFQLGKMKTCGD